MRLQDFGERPDGALINIFLVDEELPFERAFWEQPAAMMVHIGPASQPQRLRRDAVPVVCVEGMLSDLIADFCCKSHDDRQRCVLRFPDGEQMAPDAIECLAEDARLR